jgi:hypothetical protein
MTGQRTTPFDQVMTDISDVPLDVLGVADSWLWVRHPMGWPCTIHADRTRAVLRVVEEGE